MKQFVLLGATLMSMILVGCSDPVPTVGNPVPQQIVVGPDTLTQQQFLEKYCAGKSDHETCNRVSQAMAMSSGKSSSGPARF